jgi:hypothetical protein
MMRTFIGGAIAAGATASTLVLPLLGEITERRLTFEFPVIGLIFGMLAITAAVSFWVACLPLKAYARLIEARSAPSRVLQGNTRHQPFGHISADAPTSQLNLLYLGSAWPNCYAS